NALSKFLEVKIYKEGKVYYQRFENGGKPTDELKVIGECSLDRTGTSVSFKADPEIFTETIEYDYDILMTRIRELAFLNKGIRFLIRDERVEDKVETFLYLGGISEYVT